MPATLNDAFQSPFNRYEVADTTADIRAQAPPYAEPVYGQGPKRPMPQYEQQLQPSYEPQPQPQPQLGYMQQQSGYMQQQTQHNCDILINQMMACNICRQKLRDIMAEYPPLSVSQPLVSQPLVSQAGGSQSVDREYSFLINFVVGIAVLFLINKIIALYLKL